MARDAGEFGGGLWFVSTAGEVKPLASDQMNLSGFVEASAGLLAIGGLDHMGAAIGQILRLARGSSRGWSAEMLAEFPDAPLAWQRAPDEDLVVITDSGTFAIGANGIPREIPAPLEVVCRQCEPPPP